jgi:hypothetical protein
MGADGRQAASPTQITPWVLKAGATALFVRAEQPLEMVECLFLFAVEGG